MLVEIHVRDLGVIEDLDLLLGPGMTALTGETGAGKTLVVEALELLVGGRADAALVRSGAESAVVEGRFVSSPAEASARADGEDEVIVRREIPANGRSRAYINGRMATVAALEFLGSSLVDLHGQHAHQSLLHPQAQRESLDRFGHLSTAEADAARARLAELDERLERLGGDARELARETDLLRFQIAEIEAAHLVDPEEESRLEAEEAVLSAAEGLRLAAETARGLLNEPEGASGAGPDGSGATELLGLAAAELVVHDALRDLGERLRTALAEVSDVADDLRHRAEGFEADPERLAEVQGRRRRLSDLRRKYGDQLADVIAFRARAAERLADLESSDQRRAELGAERERALAELGAADKRLGDARRAAAPQLAAAVASHFGALALGRGRLEVKVGPGRGDEVSWLFGANPGEPALALEKVASGGELARLMLATRLVLSQAPPTLVFDEVDAGVGGEAALAVGRALHELAVAGHQVLVVTHLAQVAAFADDQVAVTKEERGGRTLAAARPVESEDRLVELSRMLSGQPGSATARQHAEELLGLAEGRA
ncbi:MAG TPA: DNA repair protein RecN [Acidimicrobiales bacterium]|nr:DNA repair protein RecN [Acidimicrobiales bacterium]